MKANLSYLTNFRYRDITLLITLTVIVLILVFGTLPDSTLLWRELQNSGHTLLFIPIAVLVLLLLRDAGNYYLRSPFRLYFAACFISLVIGIVIELLQMMTQGDSSGNDVLRDFSGIVIGLGMVASTDPDLLKIKSMSARRLRAVYLAAALCVFSVSMTPLAFLSVAYVQRERSFPVVVDLSANWTRHFLRLRNAVLDLHERKEVHAGVEGRFTRIDFKGGTYPGVSVLESYPDWSDYKVLKMVIFSELKQPYDLVLRIHDDRHDHDYDDRFNRVLSVDRGINDFHISLDEIKKAPSGREMNMKKIREITLFSAVQAEGLHFYLSAMRLE